MLDQEKFSEVAAVAAQAAEKAVPRPSQPQVMANATQGATALAINGDHNTVQFAPPGGGGEPPNDTLGRLIAAARPYARLWAAVFSALTLLFACLHVWHAYVISGAISFSAANEWLIQHDHIFIAKSALVAALIASIAVYVRWALTDMWRRRR